MKHDKELEARARRKLEKRAKKKRKMEAQQEVGRIEYNDPSLLCHACNKYQRELRNIVWYDTGGDGTQYCLKCNAKK